MAFIPYPKGSHQPPEAVAKRMASRAATLARRKAAQDAVRKRGGTPFKKRRNRWSVGAVMFGKVPVNIMAYCEHKHVDRVYLMEMLNGHRSIDNCSVSYVMKIADAFGFSVEEFVRLVKERLAKKDAEKADRKARKAAAAAAGTP